jgi:hypothetical protein|tara:strand:- start:4044 stop:4397 length:354 start_codon:yes stop_codon:yes gene_type:complete
MQIGLDDFALILSCQDDKEGEWTGAVDIHTYYSVDNKYCKKTQDMIVNMMSLMSTCVTLMETDKKFLEKVYKERDKIDRNKVSAELTKLDVLEDKVKKAPKVISKNGNVINVDWKKV